MGAVGKVGRECRSGMSAGKVESALVSSSFCFVLICFVFVCFVLKSPNPGQFRKTPRQQKSIIMSRKNWPCVVVVVFRIYFFLNKKKKGYRDMADPTYPTFRRRHTNTHAPPTRQHQRETTHRGGCAVETTHRGGCAVETTAHAHRPTFPTRLTNQHTRRGHARLHSQQLNNARLLMRDVLAGVGLRQLAEFILCCRQFGVSHVLEIVPLVPALDLIPPSICGGQVA